MSVFSNFGRAVRRKREQKGLSQEALADAAGLDRTYVSGVERGVRNPTLRIISILAKALDSKIEDFFADSNSEQKQ